MTTPFIPSIQSISWRLALLFAVACLFGLDAHANDEATTDALRALAEKGDAEAQVRFGLAHRDGKGVAADDAEAVRWFRRSAKQGNARGQDNLGWMLLQGRGVKKNAKAAVRWFKKSAAQNNHWGLNNLANCYDRGEGIERDKDKALEHWAQAVEAGSTYACIGLAANTLPGASETEDWTAAKVWLEKGAALGDSRCKSLLAYMSWAGIGCETNRAAAVAVWAEVDGDAHEYFGDLVSRENEPGRFANMTVDHLHQGYNLCGPTATAMAATSWGKPVHPFALKRACPDSPFGTGTDWAKLVTALKGLELAVRLDTWPDTHAGFEEGMRALREDLDQGRVVIVDVVWPENEDAQQGHTMLAVGYDEEGEQLILHDPARPHPGVRLMPYAMWKAIWHSRWYSRTSPGRSRPVIRLVE